MHHLKPTHDPSTENRRVTADEDAKRAVNTQHRDRRRIEQMNAHRASRTAILPTTRLRMDKK